MDFRSSRTCWMVRLIVLRTVNMAGRAYAERLRRIERTRRNQHCCKTDERMKRGDEFRHRGHGDFARGHGTDTAADSETPDH